MDSNEDIPPAASYERLESVVDLIDIAGQIPASTVVVAGGSRVEDLRLVESARDHDIVDRILLVGDHDGIRAAVDEVGIEIPEDDIVSTRDDEHTAAAAVELIRAGGVDIVLKGGISTPIINRHMIRLAERSTVSLATVFDAAPIAGGRPICMTDAGVTTVCNFGRLVDLIDNAVDVARTVMGLDRPRVAVLSANEKQIPSLRSTWLGKQLRERDWPHAAVYGPLSFDLATDPGSVAIKGLPKAPGAAEVAGQADVLVCPGIDSANVLYKLISALNKYGEASLASITVGFPVPYIILSRADSLETRLVSIALCAVYQHRKNAARRERESAETTTDTTAAATLEGQAQRVLVVNPGSTSMKVAVYENHTPLHASEAPCDLDPLAEPASQREQVAELARTVRDLLEQWDVQSIDAIAGRGGFLPRPPEGLPAGTYLVAQTDGQTVTVDEGVVSALLERPGMPHASNFGVPLAAELARQLGAPAYMVDPVVVDEFSPEARVSGYAPIARRSTAHALSVRAAAAKAAEAIGRPVEDVNLVVAHLGGGVTVAAVRGGKIVDNNIALLGGGPFTPQRAGELPTGELIDLCYSGKFTRDELVAELTRQGGLRSYLDTDRMEDVEARIADGDDQARLVADAMIYQIGKEIGRAVVAAGCDVEAIVLTGGLARNRYVVRGLRGLVGRLAPVQVFAESLEMPALARGAADALAGRIKVLRYTAPE